LEGEDATPWSQLLGRRNFNVLPSIVGNSIPFNIIQVHSVFSTNDDDVFVVDVAG